MTITIKRANGRRLTELTFNFTSFLLIQNSNKIFSNDETASLLERFLAVLWILDEHTCEHLVLYAKQEAILAYLQEDWEEPNLYQLRVKLGLSPSK